LSSLIAETRAPCNSPDSGIRPVPERMPVLLTLRVGFPVWLPTAPVPAIFTKRYIHFVKLLHVRKDFSESNYHTNAAA
jgi:hypothetical protein